MRGKIKLRWFGVLVILILLGMAVQINANVLDTTTETTENDDPGPKICCIGNIELINVKPGETVHEFFHVENCGHNPSRLNWGIEKNFSWGEWKFVPESGENLEIDTPILVEVFIETPATSEYTFTEKIKVKNSDDPDDYCEVDVIISTSKIYNLPSYHFLGKLVENYPVMY